MNSNIPAMKILKGFSRIVTIINANNRGHHHHQIDLMINSFQWKIKKGKCHIAHYSRNNECRIN